MKEVSFSKNNKDNLDNSFLMFVIHPNSTILSKSTPNHPHLDKKHWIFVQIYIKRPTFGQKTFVK